MVEVVHSNRFPILICEFNSENFYLRRVPGCIQFRLRRRSSAWVLKFCGVPACDRRDVGVLKRVIKAIFGVTSVPSLTWPSLERLLDLWRLWPINKINLRPSRVHVSLQNASHSTQYSYPTSTWQVRGVWGHIMYRNYTNVPLLLFI